MRTARDGWHAPVCRCRSSAGGTTTGTGSVSATPSTPTSTASGRPTTSAGTTSAPAEPHPLGTPSEPADVRGLRSVRRSNPPCTIGPKEHPVSDQHDRIHQPAAQVETVPSGPPAGSRRNLLKLAAGAAAGGAVVAASNTTGRVAAADATT